MADQGIGDDVFAEFQAPCAASSRASVVRSSFGFRFRFCRCSGAKLSRAGIVALRAIVVAIAASTYSTVRLVVVFISALSFFPVHVSADVFSIRVLAWTSVSWIAPHHPVKHSQGQNRSSEIPMLTSAKPMIDFASRRAQRRHSPRRAPTSESGLRRPRDRIRCARSTRHAGLARRCGLRS